ncbi:hypothetical protein [Streptomyces mirabilis]
MDEGPGLGEERRRRAFDWCSGVPRRTQGGADLGLAPVRRSAHAGGGEG